MVQYRVIVNTWKVFLFMTVVICLKIQSPKFNAHCLAAGDRSKNIMCGIVGIFHERDRNSIDVSLLKRMNRVQVHRGPDGSGTHIEPGLGLGHQRLSIIDLSAGAQPLYNEDKSVAVVFNGEIYNFKELQKNLQEKGHSFCSNSDTEVLVHAYEEWGPDLVLRLRGMFAFAIWDKSNEILLLARDRIGIKPLHYVHLSDGRLLFASELKSLLQCSKLSKKLDVSSIESYFAYGYIPDPATIFSEVKKLPPGFYLTIKRGEQPVLRQYWDITFSNEADSFVNERVLCQELIERLKEAVSSHLVSDVPVAAFLSGGVDSSALVALMSALSQAPIETCSISFTESQFDEASFAQVVASRYGTRHSERKVMADDVSLMDQLAAIYDEPFADSSALPTFRLCEHAASKVKVVLSGDGGDENFAGYRSYRLHLNKNRIRDMLGGPISSQFLTVLAAAYPRMDWAPRILRAKRTLEDLSVDALESFARGAMITRHGERKSLFSERLLRDLAGYSASEVMRMHAARAACRDPLSLVQYLDFKMFLPGDILTKVDRASMANSLEVRVPILDHLFVEWVAGLSPNLKLRAGEGKYIFKKALQPYLPANILYRKKRGFEIPLQKWSVTQLRKRIRKSILGGALQESGLFDNNFLRQLIKENEARIGNHGTLIWSLLQFESFFRNTIINGRDSAKLSSAA